MSTKLRKARKRNNKPYFKAAKVPTYRISDTIITDYVENGPERIPAACPTCGAVDEQPCMTNAGKVTKRHAKREAV